MSQVFEEQKAYLLRKLMVIEGKHFSVKCDNLGANWFRPFTKEENDRYVANQELIAAYAADIRNIKDLLVFLDTTQKEVTDAR